MPSDKTTLPRRCRWFGHSPHWPWQLRGVAMPFGFCPTGGWWTYCVRCETEIETDRSGVMG